MKRPFNFNAGPSAMPLSVLEELQESLLNFANTGMGITEISHRSKEFQRMLDETKDLLHELMKLPKDYEILFIQGGGTMQFLMTGYNFLKHRAAFANTGVWTKKAMQSASFFGETYEASSAKDTNFSTIPKEVQILPGTDYLYLCSNNTIYGTEYFDFPKVNVPMICDMSSDILSREMDFTKFHMIWAGIQKNLGAAGMAVSIIRKDLLAQANENIPEFLKYKTFAEKDSTYNTPPVFSIYTLNRTLHWLKNQGGLAEIEKRNIEKARLLYDAIDCSNGFYVGHAAKEDRSRMNVTFNLADKNLEANFIEKAKQEGFIGVKGHRLVGGLRISLYNAVTIEAAKAISDFMKEYKRVNG